MGGFLGGGTQYFIKGVLQLSQHERSNYLHRQSIALAQRIHETEARAASAYHNVAMEMAVNQHRRGIEQTRLMHEENMDLEKRIAMRENIRDEWGQLGARAGAILTVNTLMLGIAFLMLIDGAIPECVTMTLPVLTVAYMCLLTSAINLLLFSVRYGILLRNRIGRTLVNRINEAIMEGKTKDEQFRQKPVYQEYNRPSVTQDASEDERFTNKVEPLSTLLRARQRTEAVEEDLSQIHAFVDDSSDSYEDIRWVETSVGYNPASMWRCGRRRWHARPHAESNASGRLSPHRGNSPFSARRTPRELDLSAISAQTPAAAQETPM
jgi:hypothetical protein